MNAQRLPSLPALLKSKIDKTGQTRGADDDLIFQNRVSRSGTVLIPLSVWRNIPAVSQVNYHNGFIVLIPPDEYFATPNPDTVLQTMGLNLGTNALLFYDRRSQWLLHNPRNIGLRVATSRTAPLGGEFVARIAATTARMDGESIKLGFTGETGKGAGIRLFEYADPQTVAAAKIQLEAIFWHCENSITAATSYGMLETDAHLRRNASHQSCQAQGLLDYPRLQAARILNRHNVTVCPLCLSPLNAEGFFSRLAQAEGREVHDLTVTEVNLFHIDELRHGVLNHRPYNLGWGHHHCNVVVKDAGIQETLIWMQQVLNAQ